MISLDHCQTLLNIPGAHKASWVCLKVPTGSVEGKLHLPAKATTKLIIFQPGFPGGGGTDFENWHVDELIKSNYAVFVARHNGTILDGTYSSSYLNCDARLELAKSQGIATLGDNAPYALTDWLKEPEIAIEALALSFEQITIIGHSFGALAVMHALINMAKRQEANQALSKVKKFIALAGAVARLRKPEDPDWTAMLDDAFATDRVRVGSRNTNVGPLQDAYRLVHDKAATIPQSIEAICIHPHGDSQAGLDEVIPTEASVDLIVSLDRGVLILDKMQKADKQTGTSVHDMAKLQTKHLLEIIDLPPIKGKAILLLDERGLH